MAHAMVFILVYETEQIHGRDFDRAFLAWWSNRTRENEATLRVEQLKNEIIRLRDSAGIALFAVVIAGGIYTVVRLGRRA